MRQDYILMTDDSCDMPLSWLRENDIPVIDLSYTIDTTSYRGYDMEPKQFYDLLRAGKMPITSQVTKEEFIAFMEPFVRDGKDLFYLVFSSGLSSTCDNAIMAAGELREKYPERKIIAIDGLAASMGQGLIVYKLQKMREAGEPMEALEEWVLHNRDNVVHMVTVDDLMHLHRGGRVSKMSAIAGSMLGIKPIIHLNDEGKLIVIDKIRGRKQALINVVDRVEKCVGDTPNDTFFVSHGDCEEDAKFVAELMQKRLGKMPYMIHSIGPVIGAHTGPGVLAVFIMGKHK